MSLGWTKIHTLKMVRSYWIGKIMWHIEFTMHAASARQRLTRSVETMTRRRKSRTAPSVPLRCAWGCPPAKNAAGMPCATCVTEAASCDYWDSLQLEHRQTH